MALDVAAEVGALAAAVRRLGRATPDGGAAVPFGVLFRETADEFEALNGTLRAAKKRGLVHFDGEILLQGVHDAVEVVALPTRAAKLALRPPPPAPRATAPSSSPATASSDGDVDALVAALAAGADLDADELAALLAPPAGRPGGATTGVAPPSASAAPTPRGPGALLLARLLGGGAGGDASPAEAAAAAASVLQSLDDDDEDSTTPPAPAGASPSSSSVGPRLQAALASVCASAFDRADAGRAGALTRAELGGVLGVAGKRLDDIMTRYGVAGRGDAVVTYAGFLRLLRDDAADLRAVLRYMELVSEAAARGGGAAAAVTAAAAAPAPAPPALALRPGEVTLIFGGDDLDAVVAAAGGRLVVCAAGFTWCKPCKAFAPTLAALASAYEGAAVFTKFHANSNERTKALFKDRLHVKQTPSFALLRPDGRLAAPLVVGANAARLQAALSDALGEGDPFRGDLERAALLARLGVGGGQAAAAGKH